MEHISEDQLIELADIITNKSIATDKDLALMNHLKECDDCYKQFCHFVVISEATSMMGMNAIADIAKEKAFVNSSMKERAGQIIAKIHIVTKAVKDEIECLLEQFDNEMSLMNFDQPLAYATRGAGSVDKKTYKLEDIENNNNFIIYDSDNRKLMVQLEAVEDCSVIVGEQLYSMKKSGDIQTCIINGVQPNQDIEILVN